MPEKNYVPFAASEVLILDAGTSAKLSVVQSQVASRHKNAKIIYQDCLLAPNLTPDNVLVRYGFEERGYLVEEPLQLQGIINHHTFLAPCGWRFPKPYRLDSGQQMTVEYFTDLEDIFFSVVFYCKRADTGEPFMLYGTQLDSTKQGDGLQGATMRAPAETSLYVEGVSYGFNSGIAFDTVGVQIYDGNGMEIIKTKPNNTTAFSRISIFGSWMGLGSRGIELGEYNGWRLPAKHPFIFEAVNEDDTDIEMLVTVRGCLEVV